MRMAGFAYAPAALSMKVGDTLVFRNDDPLPHTATSSTFNSGDINAESAWRWVARRPGRYAIRCLYHPNMAAIVTVQ